MATYQQVFRSKAQGRRQHWYIHGSEPALVQDAYELAQVHATGEQLDVTRTTLFGGETTARDLEYELMREFDQDRQVVVLLEADAFQQWDELTPVLRAAGANRFFIAVAEAEPPAEVQKVFLNSPKARYVVCDALDPEDMRTWISTKLVIASDAADLLVRRSRGDHDWLLNQLRRLSSVNLRTDEVSVALVKQLCLTHGVPDFTTALMRQDRVGALDALQENVPGPRDLRELASYLGKYMTLRQNAGSVGMSPRLLIERTGLTQKEISVFRAHALYYDSQVSAQCYAALVRLQDELARSSREAYLALITLW